MWILRPAIVDDAGEACAVLRRSITELCVPDHDDDPAILEAWLANKTPERVAAWIVGNPNGFLVAAGPQGIGGVGAVSAGGEIMLNYVSPDARFQGVSSLLMAAMEQRAAAAGVGRCTLTSTVTAHRFYCRCGYRDAGPPVEGFGGKPAYPMFRVLP
jgi:GNAT superfamily N-acetyltransferase